MAKIFVATLAVCDFDPDLQAAWYATLDPEEQGRADRFYFEADRRSFVAAHGLQRQMVSRVIGASARDIRFDVPEEGGKPCLMGVGDGDVDVSISHARTAVACAVGVGCRVGIDVEDQARTLSEDIWDMVFAPQEQVDLATSNDPQARALTLWTLKEAVSKAMGVGLSMDVRRLVFTGQGGNWTFDDAAPEPGRTTTGWSVETWMSAPSVRASVAVQSNQGQEVVAEAWNPSQGSIKAYRPISLLYAVSGKE